MDRGRGEGYREVGVLAEAEDVEGNVLGCGVLDGDEARFVKGSVHVAGCDEG